MYTDHTSGHMTQYTRTGHHTHAQSVHICTQLPGLDMRIKMNRIINKCLFVTNLRICVLEYMHVKCIHTIESKYILELINETQTKRQLKHLLGFVVL